MLHNKRESAGAVMGIQIDADGAGMSGEHQNLPAGRGSVDADSLAVPVIIADARDHAAPPRVFRRDDPQQEHAHGLLPGRLPLLRLGRAAPDR